MARRQKQQRQAVIASHREQIYIKDFVSRPVAEKAVVLDGLPNSFSPQAIGKSNPLRIEVMGNIFNASHRAAVPEVASVLECSETTVRRALNFDNSDGMLAATRSRRGLRRRRLRCSTLDEIRSIIDLLVPVKSGRRYRVLKWTRIRLYSEYRKLVPNVIYAHLKVT